MGSDSKQLITIWGLTPRGENSMFDNKIKKIDDLQKEINQYHPLNRNILKQLKNYYKIGLTYSSNALEGNSLTETETKIILEDGITIGDKPLKDHYEAIGHIADRINET